MRWGEVIAHITNIFAAHRYVSCQGALGHMFGAAERVVHGDETELHSNVT